MLFLSSLSLAQDKLQPFPLKEWDSEGDGEQVKEAGFQTRALKSHVLPALRSSEGGEVCGVLQKEYVATLYPCLVKNAC